LRGAEVEVGGLGAGAGGGAAGGGAAAGVEIVGDGAGGVEVVDVAGRLKSRPKLNARWLRIAPKAGIALLVLV
jgi:hypothetical protein